VNHDPVLMFSAGTAFGFALTFCWRRLWKEAYEAKKSLHLDLITRMTARRLSLVLDPKPRGDGFRDVRKWQVFSSEGHRMAESIHWQRAVQIALDGMGPAPGCDTCRADCDAIPGKPYAICQNCGRTLLYTEPPVIRDPGGLLSLREEVYRRKSDKDD
jgi:hypothetical protein